MGWMDRWNGHIDGLTDTIRQMDRCTERSDRHIK